MGSTNITRDEARRRSDGLTLDGYHTTVDLSGAADAEQASYPVHVVLEFDSTLTEASLDFVGEGVDELLVDGQAQEVRYDGATIPLRLHRGRNTVEVRARSRYSRSGQGLHRFVDPLDGETYLYTQFEPADARRVFPCFEQPDLKAHHRISVVAPEAWQVLSNQSEQRRTELGDGLVLHDFAPTELLSTYLTALCAGPWQGWHRTWTAADGHRSVIGTWCRRSLAEHFDPDAILEVTCQGMDFYHANFGIDYPWGKYDQVFVPEYNLGAMENPGCVTFTEAYIHRSAATRAQYQGRANTILHEMAHMWFGDLVTPAWWDDLWLKESFAEFMGAHVSVAATEFTDAWVAFAGRRKAWAYAQDQLPTTHPIVADIPDVEAAKQNFDGITYAKGAAVLKQLVAHVGLDDFFAGSRDYFAAHAFSSARLADLLAALERASGRDLTAWSRAWLQTAGPDTLEPVVELDGERITRLGIRQHSTDARTGEQVGRPHTLRVGLYGLAGERLVRTSLLDVELDGREVTWLDQAVGLPAPALVLVNDEDLSYAKVGLDDTSLATVLGHLGSLDDPLARALCWANLWNMVRDARLRVADHLDAVARHGVGECDVATLSALVQQSALAMSLYLPRGEASDELVARQAERSWQALQQAAPGSDAQLVWARAVATLAARVPALTGRVQQLLDGSLVVNGLELGHELRWELATALAAQGIWGADELADELRRDPGADGLTARARALAARPDAQVKAEVWRRLHTPLALSNDHVDALVAGFMQPGQQQLVAGFSDDYFEGLEQVWQEHAIEIAQRLVGGLFPSTDDAAERAQAWLVAHPDAPRALRRLVVEGADNARRAATARAFNA